MYKKTFSLILVVISALLITRPFLSTAQSTLEPVFTGWLISDVAWSQRSDQIAFHINFLPDGSLAQNGLEVTDESWYRYDLQTSTFTQMNSWPFQQLLTETEETLLAPVESMIGEKSFSAQSPTGKYILYSRASSNNSIITIANRLTGEILESDYRATDPYGGTDNFRALWSGDETTFALLTKDMGSWNTTLLGDHFETNVTNGRIERLLDIEINGMLYSLLEGYDLSYNGDLLLIEGFENVSNISLNDRHSRLILFNTTNPQLSRVILADREVRAASFSPYSEDQILIVTDTGLILYNLTSNTSTVLNAAINNEFANRDAIFSPTGHWLVFINSVSQIPTQTNLYLVGMPPYFLSGVPVYQNDDYTPTTGLRLVFSSNRGGNHSIYSSNLQGTNVQVLSSNAGGEENEPACSLNGYDIAYHVLYQMPDQIYRSDIYNPSNNVLLTFTEINSSPSWSPDGTKIAFSRRLSLSTDIYSMSADGSNLRQLSNHRAVENEPSWSPDGTKIAFERHYSLGIAGYNTEIMVMNADGTNVQQLTNNTVHDYDPSWSPDGTKIVFSSDRDGNLEIYSMNANGTGVVRLTDHPAFDSMPSWSPDGRLIAFVSDRDDNYEIYTMDVSGENISRVTDNQAEDFSPCWLDVDSLVMPTGTPINGFLPP